VTQRPSTTSARQRSSWRRTKLAAAGVSRASEISRRRKAGEERRPKKRAKSDQLDWYRRFRCRRTFGDGPSFCHASESLALLVTSYTVLTKSSAIFTSLRKLRAGDREIEERLKRERERERESTQKVRCDDDSHEQGEIKLEICRKIRNSREISPLCETRTECKIICFARIYHKPLATRYRAQSF